MKILHKKAHNFLFKMQNSSCTFFIFVDYFYQKRPLSRSFLDCLVFRLQFTCKVYSVYWSALNISILSIDTEPPDDLPYLQYSPDNPVALVSAISTSPSK